MIEVFKTNVDDRGHADLLLCQIHQIFHGYQANFDLDDCDKILRVKCTIGSVESYHIINLVRSFGCHAEVLPDDDQPLDEMMLTRQFEI